MKIIKTVKEFEDYRSSKIVSTKSIGFVPTMGALHKGHLSLIEKSVINNDITIVSIFVNPRQFNDQNDYNNYPINIDEDIKLLESVKCDVLFSPLNDDIYKSYSGFKMDFKGLDNLYEGEFRPGHFQGVVDIVYLLFSIVKPNNSYFGEKDFQQLAIIKLMVKQSGLKINIVPCPIVRELSGLAMSSRNKRLNVEEQGQASNIYKVLRIYKDKIKVSDNPQDIIIKITEEINKEEIFEVEYVVFCDAETLESIEKFKANTNIMLCLAVWCKKVRLIDNISLQF